VPVRSIRCTSPGHEPQSIYTWCNLRASGFGNTCRRTRAIHNLPSTNILHHGCPSCHNKQSEASAEKQTAIGGAEFMPIWQRLGQSARSSKRPQVSFSRESFAPLQTAAIAPVGHCLCISCLPYSPLRRNLCAFCAHIVRRPGGPRSVVAVFPVLADATERVPPTPPFRRGHRPL